MTFDELDQKFANGMDSAKISEIAIDYAKREVAFQISIRSNPPDSPNRDEYRIGKLRVLGFYYLSIEPPDAEHLTERKHTTITVDGFPEEDPARFQPFELLRSTFPPGAFCCRFFVFDWNSFIHVAGADAEFSWDLHQVVNTTVRSAERA